MDSDINFYTQLVRLKLQNDKKDDEESIVDAITFFQKTFNYSDEVAEAVKKKILMVFGHTLDMGTMISDNSQEPWFLARTKTKKMALSNRNLSYLLQNPNLSPDVVSKLDSITDAIMDGFGDPEKESFSRRGLVMGDVQSGKTNTYTRLSCKAADVGYRMIILLTGTLENLRQQTQRRLDEGLVGYNTAAMVKKNAKEYIGAGQIDPDPEVAVFTHTEGDFKEVVATQLNLPITDLNFPVLLVVKKNAKILDNLSVWLNNHRNGGLIRSPLLLIDDEADNASINTSKDNVTAINSHIRTILSYFQKNTYVGFTATPYANIFINPDDETDLYPDHFIYCLRSPNNYVSPKNIYQNEGKYHFMLKEIELSRDNLKTGLPEIPYKHTKTFELQLLPTSLKEAINCFLLSCAIRDIRGQTTAHMSMLINASRFTDVQESVRDRVEEYVFKVRTSIEVHSKLPVEEATRDEFIASLYTTWASNYQTIGYDWKVIQLALSSAVKTIVVRSVNQKNGAKQLNYEDYKNDGLRLIAIGGNSLSRGLTLEGLCISYFYRRAQSYDTLMQMGRWFGYRDGYSDLCRIWMTRESIMWYEQISYATEELKREFILMYNNKKTPREFGFRVKSDITGLMVTARNKMRYAGDDVIVKSLNGTPILTSSISTTIEKIQSNEELVFSTIQKLMKYHIHNSVTDNDVFVDIPAEFIKDFIQQLEYPEENNIIFDRGAIIGMLDSGAISGNWDLAIQHGSGDEYNRLAELGLHIKKSNRSNYCCFEDRIQFYSNSLMGPSHMREGLYNNYLPGEILDDSFNGKLDGSKERIKALESKYLDQLKEAGETDPPETPPAKAYLSTDKRRPILLIYPLDLFHDMTDDGSENYKAKRELLIEIGRGATPIGVAIGFPKYYVDPNNPLADRLLIKYKTTVVYNKMGGNEDLDQEDE